MRRKIIGLLALGFLLGAAVFWLWPPRGVGYQQYEAGCWRLGVVMAVWWLAYPQTRLVPGWLWVVVPALLLLLVTKPKWFLLVLPIIIVLVILKPRIGRRR